MSLAPILKIIRDGETLKSCPIEGEVLLGRAEGCVIRLEDRAISREHALLRPSSEGVEIQKRSEFALLRINGAECTSAILSEGDVIAIGPYLLELSYGKKRLQPEVSPVAESAQPETQPIQENEAPQSLLSGLEEQSETRFLSELPEIPNSSGMIQDPLDRPALVEVSEEGETQIQPLKSIGAQLIFEPGLANYEKFDFLSPENQKKSKVVIGRGQGSDILLNDKKSSRLHTVIFRQGNRFFVEDLGSANGTYVDGKKIQHKQELTGSDQIRIGDSEFSFKILSQDYFEKEKDFLPVSAAPESSGAEEVPDVPLFELGLGASEVQSGSPVVLEAAPLPVATPMAGVEAISSLPAAALAPGITESPAPDLGLGIPGVSAVPLTPQKLPPKTLIGKGIAALEAMPPKRRAVWLTIIILGMYGLFFDEEVSPVKKKPKPKPSVVATAPSGVPGVAVALSPAQLAFVEQQYQLAFDYFKNQDFDKSLYELEKIFLLTSEYKDARDIERYAKEGKRRLEAKEEEKRRKEEEVRIKAKIEELENEAREKMSKKQYDQAREIFPQIHLLDPENALVQKWTEEIEDAEQEAVIAKQKEDVRKEVNRRAWEIYQEGLRLKTMKKYYVAIAAFIRAIEIQASDPKVEKSSRARIVECRSVIQSARDPLLKEAKELEESKEFAKAYQVYFRAAQVDSRSAEAQAGMNRIREILHDHAKVLYTEGVLAESYSDFATAKKKFDEVLKTTPKEDVYFERAQRKSARYFKLEESSQ